MPIEAVLDAVRQTTPCVIVDLPHLWTPWIKATLIAADEIVHRGDARSRQPAQRQEHRRADPPGPSQRRAAASWCSTRSASPKRPEIPAKDFAETIGLEAVARSCRSIRLLFGQAANNGQMLIEVAAQVAGRRGIRRLAELVTGRTPQVAAESPRRSCRSSRGRRERKACSASAPHPTDAPPRPSPQPASPPARRRSAAQGGCGAARAAAAGGAGRSAPKPSKPSRAQVAADSRSEDYYQIKTTIFSRADRHDRSGAARAARSGFGARGNPRHRQRDHLDQGGGDVDRRAGTPAPGHLQRRARLRSARAAAGARRHRRHHGQRRQPRLHRSRRQGAAHQHPLPRQCAADEHLPAHRQPGRPPRRRILADLRRAPARRLPRQRDRAAAVARRAHAHHS